MTPDTVTVVWVVVFMVVIFGFDFLRLKQTHNATISEVFWKLTSTSVARASFMVGLLTGVVLGHLLWQSTRTYRALQCEQAGGLMQCVGGK